jgi:pyridoxine 5-phosphate synthase
METGSCMTKLSVKSINCHFETAGGDNPNVVQAAIDVQRFGADGVTIHPRR